MQAFQDAFEFVDVDFSGMIDMEEWFLFLRRMEQRLNPVEAQLLFLHLDSDRDGLLTMLELLQIVFSKLERRDQVALHKVCWDAHLHLAARRKQKDMELLIQKRTERLLGRGGDDSSVGSRSVGSFTRRGQRRSLLERRRSHTRPYCPWGRSIVASSSASGYRRSSGRRRGPGWLSVRSITTVVLVGGRLGLRLLDDDGVRERLRVPLLGRPDADDGDLLALLLLGRGLGVDARPLGVRRRGGPAAVGGRGWSRRRGRRETGDGARLVASDEAADLPSHASVDRPDDRSARWSKSGRAVASGSPARVSARSRAIARSPGSSPLMHPRQLRTRSPREWPVVHAEPSSGATRRASSFGLARELPGPVLGRRQVRVGQGPERRVAVAVGLGEHRMQPVDVRHRRPAIAQSFAYSPHGVVEALLRHARFDGSRRVGPRRREVAGRRRPGERERAGRAACRIRWPGAGRVCRARSRRAG